MKISDFEWVLTGESEKGETVSIEIAHEDATKILHIAYEKNPEETGFCKQCAIFQECLEKIIDAPSWECKEFTKKD